MRLKKIRNNTHNTAKKVASLLERSFDKMTKETFDHYRSRCKRLVNMVLADKLVAMTVLVTTMRLISRIENDYKRDFILSQIEHEIFMHTMK